jgi:hypothetical protein
VRQLEVVGKVEVVENNKFVKAKATKAGIKTAGEHSAHLGEL